MEASIIYFLIKIYVLELFVLPYSTLFVFGYTGVFGISWPRSMPGLFILPNRHVTTPFFIPNDNESCPFDETALN